MTSIIQKVVQNAAQLFRTEMGRSKIARSELENLKTLVNCVTAEDLNMNDEFLQNQGDYNSKQDSAPVTYMQIYQDDNVNICIFILKGGVKLPLHDHPQMHGLLKVIHGTVDIQSFSMSETKDSLEEAKKLSCIRQARKHPSITISEKDPACLLLPEVNNIHEIASVEGPAAFLDILSPPYGNDRECHYYQEIKFHLGPNQHDATTSYLLSIPTPREFWCDRKEYVGPSVDHYGTST